ncbi:hypothetical protein C8J57DRAFT_1660003, partial [Mycena rebaudengoi]
MKESMKALEELSHSNRLAISAAEQSDKGTEPAYARHLKSYLSWWSTDQGMRMAQAPGWKEIPALPITCLKGLAFLSYETTREKKKRNSSETLEGTTVGKSQGSSSHLCTRATIASIINTSTRMTVMPTVKLREDTRIRAFESA